MLAPDSLKLGQIDRRQGVLFGPFELGNIIRSAFSERELRPRDHLSDALDNYFNSQFRYFMEETPLRIIKLDEVTDRAKHFLLKDKLLMKIVEKMTNKVKAFLTGLGRRYRITIYTSRDMEVPDWEEVVFSIKVDERDFDTIIALWDKIEDEIETVIGEMKQNRRQEASYIDKIYQDLAIEVDRIINV